MYTQWDAAEVVAVRRARERARGERMRTAAAAGAFVDRMERLGWTGEGEVEVEVGVEVRRRIEQKNHERQGRAQVINQLSGLI